MWKFQGSKKEKCNFKGDQENIMWNFHRSWFSVDLKVQWMEHNFVEFSGVNLHFAWNFQE